MGNGGLVADILAGAPGAPIETLEQAREALLTPVRSGAPLTLEHAARVAARADRLGLAFAAGYWAATDALARRIGRSGPFTLAASEAGGAHPRAIRSSLTPEGATFRLRGEKQWATLAQVAPAWLVIATRGERDGRPDLAAVWIAAETPGVALRSMPETSFCPEIPHARLELELAVEPGAIVPGDAYTGVVKPFRTLEDVAVHAAVSAFMLGAARRFGAAEEHVSRMAALLELASGLFARARGGDDDAALHVSVDGLLSLGRGAMDTLEAALTRAPPEFLVRLARDRPLLAIAGRARDQRRARAFERLARDEAEGHGG